MVGKVRFVTSCSICSSTQSGLMIEDAISLSDMGICTIHEEHLRDTLTEIERLRGELSAARDAALEEAAKVVDACNYEGPYQAIDAASKIRALKGGKQC